jgi:MFS family permease
VYPPLLPELVGALGVGVAAAGLLGTAFSLPRSLLALPSGALIDRLGASRTLHLGMALVLVGTLLAAVAPSMGVMAVARAMAGLGYGTTAVVGILYLMRSATPDQRARRGNMYEGALITANAVSGYLAGRVAVQAGWRWGFGAAAAAVGGGWAIAGWRVFPAVRAVLHGRPPAGAGPAATGAEPHARPLALLAIHLVVGALSFGWAGAITTLVPLYGGQALGLSAADIGRTLAIAYGIEAFLLLPVGWAADTFGRLRVLLPGLAVVLAGVVLLPFTAAPPGYTVAAALVIAGMTVWMIPPALLAEHLGGRFGGRAVGVYRFVADLGMVTAPVVVGSLSEWGGFGLGAGVIALVLAASGGVAALALRRPPAVTAGRIGRP